MRKEIKIWLIGSVSVILISFIAILIAFRLTFPDLNEVAERDWYDDWEKESRKNHSTRFDLFKKGSGIYVIRNFLNNPETVLRSIEKIDSIKITQNSSLVFFKFLWNGKYNHDWRVEYINQKYVDEIATLFSISLVYPQKTKHYLIENIKLYPALEKKQMSKPNITIDSTNIQNLLTDYENGFDFFMWNELQNFTKPLITTKSKSSTFRLLSTSSKKEIVKIKWYENGYRLFFP